jgi:hypothetical protein
MLIGLSAQPVSRHDASTIGDTVTVLNDLDQIEAAFVGTPLAGLPIGYGPSGTVLVADIDRSHLHEAWQAADALVPVIGRLPVMVTDEYGDPLTIGSEPEPGPSESELREFAEAAESSEPWLAFRHYSEDDEVDGSEIEYLERRLAGIDVMALLSDVALPTARQTLERTLYDRLIADDGLHARVLDSVRFVTQTEYWYTPDNVLLMLLPTNDVRGGGAWVDFFGALTDDDQQKLAEVLARWRHRWDARLVAAWGTVLQFQVGRRSAPGDDAWTAAGQLKALGPNLEMSRWELAVALPGGDAWLVHNRP